MIRFAVFTVFAVFLVLTPILCLNTYALTKHTLPKSPKQAPYADLICVGQEPRSLGGKIWQIRVDFNAKKIHINQDHFKLDKVHKIKNGAVLYTEDFITSANIYAYNAIISDQARFYFHQYKTKPDKYIGGIELACHQE